MMHVQQMQLPLSLEERDQLDVLEEVIDNGLQTFVDVGNALMEIRDDRLYREAFSTFEDYCRERWGMKRSYAYELIDAAAVSDNVRNSGHSLTAVSQARPLTRLEPEQQREVWQRAVETAPEGRVTAKHVAQVAQEFAPKGVSVTDTQGEVEGPADRNPPGAARFVNPNGEDDVIVSSSPTKHAVHFSSESDDWPTPPDLFECLDDEFNFTLDVCASAGNAKCPQYFTIENDGLLQDWRGVCWMNPPYGREIGQWVAKAHDSAANGATVVCLVPARTDTAWWWDYCIKGEIRFIRGRLKFGDAQNSAPFPSAIVVFYPGVSPNDQQVIWWGGFNDGK